MALKELQKLFRKNKSRFATVEGNLLSAAGGNEAQMVLVTSCRPRQGATVAAACLAYALASDAGSPTLLIDACTNTPRQHTLFDAPEGPGLSDLMAGQIEPEKAVHPTAFPNLYLMPMGTKRGQPLNASRRSTMVDLLKTLSGRYHYMIIDTDSLSSSSGVTLLAPHVSGVVLVVEAGRTKRAEVTDARAKIEQVGGTLLGAVLNKAST